MADTVSRSQPPDDPRATVADNGSDGRAARTTGSTGRFEHIRTLGQGSMGTVYLVVDRETGERIALKKLFGMDAKTVTRIKREFRLLADLAHPNLVKMYELGRDEEGWFLCMEHVDGEPLDGYLSGDALSTVSMEASLSELASYDERINDRALPAFYQLAQGVHALHQAGILHRDLKPSNVLVEDGRVVVLDFGLVQQLDAAEASMTLEGGITGTPAYMAPEQVTSHALSEVTDWYAFGVMLFEALTGELPFDGPVLELLQTKVREDPPAAQARNPEVPNDINALCVGLLAREPTARPAGEEVLSVLSRYRGDASAPVSERPGRAAHGPDLDLSEPHPLYGREREHAVLQEAMARVLRGNPAVVHLRGVSGGGKSALAERFLDELERAPDTQALLLRSRCHEREAMPFKALDGVIDALARYLTTVHDYEVSNLLPTDVAVLARLFPVLGRLRAVQHMLSVSSADGDARLHRRRAEAALREMFGRLSARTPVVIWIDDLQWGDLDSAVILRRWLQGALTGPVLLLLSYRSDEVETSGCLRAVLADADPHGITGHAVDLAPLTLADLRAMCAHELGERAEGHAALIEHLAREADGSPFLASQLSALALAKLRRGDEDLRTLSIRDLAQQSMAMLKEDARRALRVLAVAGRPLSPSLTLRVAGVRRHGREALYALHRMHLLRSRDLAGERVLELYHDRVRDGVYALLDARERRALHAALLAALEQDGHTDPDWLHALALGAEQNDAALRYGLQAAERARSTLAFERAAELYRRCVSLSRADTGEQARLYHQLAIALGACGRGVDAAEAHLRAADLLGGEAALPHLRRATSHLLRSGRFEQGEQMVQRVLDTLEIRVPKTTAGRIARIGWDRVRLSLRGTDYAMRPLAEVPQARLARLDACNALRNEIMPIDPLRAAILLNQQLSWALDAGEPMRVLNALCGVGFMEASTGGERQVRAMDKLLVETAALAESIGTVEARAEHCATAAIVWMMLGRPEQVLEPAREAEQLLRSHAGGDLDVTYYLRLAVAAAHTGALYETSDYRTFSSVLDAALGEARAADNRAALLYLALPETLRDEFAGRSVESVSRLEEQRRHLPSGGFAHYHALHMSSVCVAACLSGNYAWGLGYLENDWPRFTRSLVRHAPVVSLACHALRLRLILNAELMGKPDHRRLKRLLSGEIRAFGRLPLRGRAVPLANLLRVRIMHAMGRTDAAIALLRQTVDSTYHKADAGCARYTLGLLLGGDEGTAERAKAAQALEACGVTELEAHLFAFIPELMDGV